MIPNHFSAALSELDLRAARTVPPGGNWKNIPLDVPLKRLDTIRASFSRGEGSRSTYYGRLRADRPAYTINTYFSRPGNGCHLHYDFDGGQHRVLSQREAARLQSFPDDYVFLGPKAAINQQIGNAVPPLLSFQMARQLGDPGIFVDLFCGAGGLGYGFKCAGWQPAVANDIIHSYLETYATNVHPDVVPGDIRRLDVFTEIVDRAMQVRRRCPDRQLWVLGGPPCQGFSTAGKPRSMRDERNQLFREYERVIRALDPDGFIFENVPGLLNMEGGRVFAMIREALADDSTALQTWVLSAEQHAIPQRRRRVVLVGSRNGQGVPLAPLQLTEFEPSRSLSLFSDLPPAVAAREALDDLPPLSPGADGSYLLYRSEPTTNYQCLMRRGVGITEYLRLFDDVDHGLAKAISLRRDRPTRQPLAGQSVPLTVPHRRPAAPGANREPLGR